MAQAINLQITPSNVMPKIYASQFDIGREIEVSLYDGASAYTPPVGTEIRFEGKKPDGNGFSYACTYTGNVVTVVTTAQMTVLAGEIPCELRMSLNGNDLGTLNIIFVIEKSPIDENVPISDTEIPAIIELARDEQYTAEAWATGERNGVPVGPTDPQYHNNAKYWAEHAEYGALDDLTDVEITTPTNGQVVTYNGTSQKWENKDIPSDTVTQAIIAPVEGATSLHAYAVGEQLIYNDTLYKVIAPIAVNDALVVNTNIEVSPKTVIEQVEDNASEIDDVWSTMAQNGAHNLIPYPYAHGISRTNGGATFTVDNKGVISVIATGSTVDGWFTLTTDRMLTSLEVGKSYILSGGLSSSITLNLYFIDSSNQQIGSTVVCEGSPVTITVPSGTDTVGIALHVSATVPSAQLVYPMIRLATDANTEYKPYVPTNRDSVSYRVNTKLGAHNRCENNFTTQSVAQVTWTVNANTGVITVSGTPNANSYTSSENMHLPKGVYKMHGMSGTATNVMWGTVDLRLADRTLVKTINVDSADDYILDTTGYTYDIVDVAIKRISNGVACSGTIYPLITAIEDTDPTYSPYTMTNGELTEYATLKTYRDSTTGAMFTKIGRVCLLNLESTGGYTFTASADAKIIDIPSDFLPLYGTNISFKEVLNNKRLFARNDNNGSGIYTNDALSSVVMRGSFMYITNS